MQNIWIQKSIEYANCKDYLDRLFAVYPMSENPKRQIDESLWKKIENAFDKKDNGTLIQNLLDLELFPMKDSYTAFLKKDKAAIKRNPKTVARLAGRLYDMGLNKMYENSCLPKETNRQIGQLFKHWLSCKALGLLPVSQKEFMASKEDAILDANDKEAMLWAKENVGFKRNKGLDFVARFNQKYVIGEAKFLSDFGGHQDTQLEDAISTIESPCRAVKIAILDGVVWLRTNNKMFKTVTERHQDKNIMSALVLRDFLYSL